MRTALLSLSFLCFLSFTALAQNEKADKLVGVWQPSDGRSYIKIDKIGNKFYGRIVWLKEIGRAHV